MNVSYQKTERMNNNDRNVKRDDDDERIVSGLFGFRFCVLINMQPNRVFLSHFTFSNLLLESDKNLRLFSKINGE